MNDHEKRYSDGIELRASAGATPGPGTLVGYAAKFDRPSDVLRDKRTGRTFVERINRGAFARSLKTADVRAMYDHDTGKILGRSSAGTLRMTEDSVGLRVEIDLPDTTAGRDTAFSVGRGDVRGMSFGFYTPKDGDEWDRGQDPPVRSLKHVNIDDVTVTAFPAYPDTEVALRSLDRATAVAAPEPAPAVEPESRALDASTAAGSVVSKLDADPAPSPTPRACRCGAALGDDTRALCPACLKRDETPEAPKAEATPEPIAGTDPAVRMEHERHRDLLRLLRAR